MQTKDSIQIVDAERDGVRLIKVTMPISEEHFALVEEDFNYWPEVLDHYELIALTELEQKGVVNVDDVNHLPSFYAERDAQGNDFILEIQYKIEGTEDGKENTGN